MAKKKKAARKSAAAPSCDNMQAVRAMTGPAVASMMAAPDEAAARVALGWQPMGTNGGRVVLVADSDAVMAWNNAQGETDEE